MANKTINSRLTLKYDTYQNWTTANPVLLKGEACIVEVPASAGAVVQEPAILIKVGDGTTAFTDLPFGSAKAADVYDWAKAATKPSYKADEITGLADYISGEIQDSDTQYQLVKVDDYNYKLQSKPLGGSWADVAGSTVAIPQYDDTALAARVTANEGAITTLNGDAAVAGSVAKKIADAIAALDLANTYESKGSAAQALVDAKAYTDELAAKVGAVSEGKTVVQMIEEAKSAATYDDTALKGRVSALEGSDAGKSVRTIANEELAAQLIPENAKESMDTLAEVAAWIQSHPDDASAMNAAIAALQAIVAGIGGDGEKATVVAYVTDAIAALKIGDYAKSADLTALAARVATAETKLATVEEGAQVNVVEGVQVNGANVTVTDKKVNIAVPTGALADKDKVAEADLETELADKINGKADDADLSAIAKSGNMNDLIQTDGDYIIINCGSATTVI